MNIMQLKTAARAECDMMMRLFFTAGIVVIVDQLTKYIVLTTMPLNGSIAVIPGLFDLTHLHNPGGAFGFMADKGPFIRKLLFIFFSGAAMILVFYLYRKTPKNFTFLSFGLALIFGGAVGNMIDRIRMGKVVDFLDFYINGIHWPAFNVADSAVSIGVTIFVVHLLFNKLPKFD